MRIWVSSLVLICLSIGCSDATLETGYKPRSLSDSPAVRRSYYASPFTPEAQAPAMEKDQDFESRRPRQGGY